MPAPFTGSHGRQSKTCCRSPQSMHFSVSQSKKFYSSSSSIRVKELQNKHISLPLRLALSYGMTPVILLAVSLLSPSQRILLLPASEYNSYDMLISFSYLIKQPILSSRKCIGERLLSYYINIKIPISIKISVNTFSHFMRYSCVSF